jgi:hypothetical protein
VARQSNAGGELSLTRNLRHHKRFSKGYSAGERVGFLHNPRFGGIKNIGISRDRMTTRCWSSMPNMSAHFSLAVENKLIKLLLKPRRTPTRVHRVMMKAQSCRQKVIIDRLKGLNDAFRRS